MRDSRPSLYAYIITSLFVLVFYVLKWEDFIIVAKPVIVPAIFYYYLQTTKRPINILFTAALWFFFIADMIEIVDPANGVYQMMFCGLLSYLIMLRFASLDAIKLIFNFKTIIVTLFVLAFLAVVSGQVIMCTNTINTSYFYFFIVYTIIVFSMFSYAILRIFSKNDTTSKLLLAMVIAMFLSDYLYAYNRYVEFYMIGALVSMIAQFISYYWMVEYFNRRQEFVVDDTSR